MKKAPETKRCTHPLMPDYQMPGRLDCTDPSDAFSKRVPKKENTTLQNAAQASLGITEGSKLYSASRKGSEVAVSEKSISKHSAVASQKSSQAQKLDKFI